MKKSTVILLNLGYWTCCFLVLFLLSKLMMSLNQTLSGARVFKLILGFAIVPSIIAFYSFYSNTFHQFLKQKRFVKLILYGFCSVIISALCGALTLSLLLGGDIMFADGFNSFFGDSIQHN
jgi:hypothetical protein